MKGAIYYSVKPDLDAPTLGIVSGTNQTTTATGASSIPVANILLSVPHNFLNLPTSFSFNAGNSIELLYDGLGTKLRRTVKTAGSVTLTQDYLGSIELKNNVVEAVYNEEGRAYNTGSGYRYEYVLRDHLGNTRLVFTDKDGSGSIDNSEILSESHYYPFGRKMDGAWYSDASAGKYRYLYNGKELSDEFDLNFYDYGARWYDPGMGNWWQSDPIGENHYDQSPYQYVLNNPIRYIDPFGLWERTSTGYTTSDQNDIRRYTNYLRFETEALGNSPSLKQMDSFISGEMGGNGTGLGTMSNGGKLISEIKDRGYQNGGAIYWQADKASVANAWHDVQGDLTPDALDPRTIGGNILGLTYSGAKNPRTYGGNYDYSYTPTDWADYPAIGHDSRYDRLGITGKEGLFKDTRAIGADWRFVTEEMVVMTYQTNPIAKIRTGIVGIGLGLFSLPKTLYKLYQPGGYEEIKLWYNLSNYGVTNSPSKP
ncbi:RHS repeat-associated core domain-containing protein [Spirosoma jeollabukense]